MTVITFAIHLGLGWYAILFTHAAAVRVMQGRRPNGRVIAALVLMAATAIPWSL